MGRALSDKFFAEFDSGDLRPLVDLINKEGIYKSRFMFQLRGNQVIIYYKCAVALVINAGFYKYNEKSARYVKTKTENSDSLYCLEYTLKYAKDNTELKELLSFAKQNKNKFYLTKEQIKKFNWQKYLSLISDGIDTIYLHKDNAEKESQQRIWYENNIAKGSNATEYVIVDTEYTEENKKGKKGRFDLIALYWPNHKQRPEKIAMIELKYTESAFGGSVKARQDTQVATLKTHYDDFLNFQFNQDFYKDISKMFFQLYKLGMIDMTLGSKVREENLVNADTKKQMMFILANYNPESELLKEQFSQMSKFVPENSEVVFAISSYCGYGLYGHCMKDRENFIVL